MNDGFILINKHVGPTSRKIVNSVSRALATKKVGHIGSLDPFATGLLIISVNKGTKAGRYLEDLDKTYVATINFTAQTNTGDLTGKVIKTKPIITFSKDQIKEVLNSFLGESLQLPPMHSAIKIAGTPLYKHAFKGQVIEREKRLINVKQIKLLNYEVNQMVIVATVSKGTYMRTLAEDIAEKLHMVAHLSALERIMVGPFSIKDAVDVTLVNPSRIISIYQGLSFMSQYVVNEAQRRDILVGKPLILPIEQPVVLIVDHHKQALAVYVRDGHLYISQRGLF